MFYELSIALTYLLPRRRQLSRSVISLISIGVISLVVWLILVFFSVTTGLERIWVEKMVALTAPVRVIPNEKYYNSYYHQVDNHSENAGFTAKSLVEKWNQSENGYYALESDPELPEGFPLPDLDENGVPKDVLALLKTSTSKIEDIRATPYAMAPANLRLTLAREGGPLLLTQAVYVGTFDGGDPIWSKTFGKETQSPLMPLHNEKSSVWHLPSLPMIGDGILVPKVFQESGVKVGDRGTLSYVVPGIASLHEAQKEIFVSGFYDPGILPLGGRFILASPEVTDSLQSAVSGGEKGLSEGINIKFDDMRDAKEIKNRLIALFDRNGIPDYFDVLTYEEYDFTKDLIQQLKSEKNIFSLLALIILLVACSNIISMLIILVNDKKKEIAILRAMGATSFSISFIFGLTGAIMGMAGTLIGLLLALFTLHHFDLIIALLTKAQGFQPFNPLFFGSELPSQLSTEALFFVFLSTFFLSVISGLIPAWKASRFQPAEVLRAE